MNISADSFVKEVVKSNFKTARLFQDYNIDYCCGGNKPLEAALQGKKLDADFFINLLNRQKKNVNMTETPLDLNRKDLIAYIIKTQCIILKTSQEE
ncbi:MAG TPA: hypothetical protein DEG09_04680 [Marinilabiliaceae bacterium]|nr:hypothetical protein [Marinilabiliaceae bacterium]